MEKSKSSYNFKDIEKKWQKKWEGKKIFQVKEDKNKEKFYCLEMFPYPSGSGLHMGHALNYTLGDIYSRFKRMKGFNVLYPMGYDALGLPAENAAIKDGTHPEDYTDNSITNFIKQQKMLGLSYDWSRIINTSKPDYYKWDQWIFLKMLEKGLAYQKEAVVNWCPSCKTVLANEQAQTGNCERCKTKVEIKKLKQWFFKITDYADELLDKLDDLDWPQRTKTMQKNWIGKSYGTEIYFEIENRDISNVVIVHGSPSKEEYAGVNPPNKSHWLSWLSKKLEEMKIKSFVPLMPECWNPNYKKWKKEFGKIFVDENSVLIGHSAGGGFLVRWLGETKKKIKKLILVAPAISNKKKEYWEMQEFYIFKINKKILKNIDEIILYISDDDDKSILESVKVFSKELDLVPKKFKGYGHFCKGDMGTEEFPELFNEIILKQKFPIFTTRPDTIFGVTFLVISAQHPKLFDLVTKEQKKEVEKFLKSLKGVSEKQQEELDKQGVFIGSYAINPLTKEKVPIYAGNFVIADYGSGMVMAVPAHDQRDFLFAKKYNIPIKVVIDPIGEDIENSEKMTHAYTENGNLINSKNFDGIENKKAVEVITKYLQSKKLGRKVVQYKLRDWLISRQRYWGTPIPVVYCDKCGVIPIPEKDLPVKLPKKVKFGEGNPLLTNNDFLNVKCPKCKGEAKRETDTMDTFVNSSWYFLRYCDAQNKKSIFDKEKVRYWMPIDMYIGGAEHACMHLIYFRFYTKFLRDLGLIDFGEPVKKLFHQGMLHGEEGDKMSKSKGNIVLPETVSNKYGIDAARLFLISIASPDKNVQWSEKGINGSLKFINKVLDYFESVKMANKDSPKLLHKLNFAIKKIEEDIENFKYNLAAINLRSLFDIFYNEKEVSKVSLEKFLKLFHPFCPHITEELWEKIGNKSFISLSEWPKVEEKKIDEGLEQQEKVIDNLVRDINHVLGMIKEKPRKVFIYVLPNELKNYLENKEIIENKINLEINFFSVNEKDKYDPENKSKKVKPGRPGIYLE